MSTLIVLLIFLTLFLVAYLGLRISHNRLRGLKVKDFSELKLSSVNIDGHDISYIQTGKGPDVVLVHGIGANIFAWRYLIPILSPYFRVTALDLPGFGKSSKIRGAAYDLDSQVQRLDKFISALNIERCFLVGSSMGGAISLWAAKTFPARYPKIAVLSPATQPKKFLHVIKPLKPVARYSQPLLNITTLKSLMRFVIADPKHITDQTASYYLEPYLDGGESIKAFLSATSILTDPRLPRDLREMPTEVLILRGEQDPLVTAKDTQHLFDVLTKRHIYTHPRAGHHCMEDDPDWTAEHLVKFFSTKQ